MAGTVTRSGRINFQSAESIAQQRLFHDLPALSADFLDVQLDNAGVLDLTTPVTLVPAQGADRAIIVERVLLVCDATLGVYIESTDNLTVEYSGGLDILIVETTGFIDQAGVEIRHQAPAEAVVDPPPNEAVVLHNVDGEFTGGNAANTLSVRVYFRVVDTVPFS